MTMRFVGPIISTENLEIWERLLIHGFNLSKIAAQVLDTDAVETLWGLTGHSANTAVFETAGTPDGIRVVQFTPVSTETIRTPDSGYDCNALKVIDFYTPDFDKARRQLEDAGFSLKAEVAEYDLKSAKVTEAHLWGPDDVVCALIGGPLEFFQDFVTVTDAVFSEVMSVSAPVDRPGDVLQFYKDMGLQEVYRYGVDDESFGDLVGTQSAMTLRAVNVGTHRKEPYFGIIHYGLPETEYKSLADKARLPNRGLVGGQVLTEDINSLRHVCETRSYLILAGPSSICLAPYGSVFSMTVRAPHGVLHQFIQTETPYKGSAA